jgi:hypothetical protein
MCQLIGECADPLRVLKKTRSLDFSVSFSKSGEKWGFVLGADGDIKLT